MAEPAQHVVELMVRTTCGTCARVRGEVEPVAASASAEFVVRNVDEDSELAMEYGDRVPVVVVDGEEFASWDVNGDDLTELAALLNA